MVYYRMSKVAIVGSGLIGRSWAVLFSRGGYNVVLYDVQQVSSVLLCFLYLHFFKLQLSFFNRFANSLFYCFMIGSKSVMNF